MKLKKILKNIPLEVYRGSKEIEITGLSENSKTLVPGNLFVAKKGYAEPRYIEEAIATGASAVLAPTGNPFIKDVVQLIHPDIKSIEGKLAAAFYENPSEELFVVGVTGTNGKTTLTYLLKHFLESMGKRTGMIGTVEYVMGTKRCVAERTTPDVIANHKMMREMVSLGCQAAVLEVTSHGLVQGRVDDIDFDVAVFTNLTHDHLDYHKTFEAYAEAKALLFSRLSPDKRAIVYYDTPWSKRMIADCRAPVLSFGFSSEADLYAHDVELTGEGTRFKATYRGQTVSFSWSAIGRHNVLNALAALLVMISQGFSLENLVMPLAKFSAAPGRLERVGRSTVFVDYAHSPDALENVLKALQEFKKGRIITVFGCGGERDRGKRPLMAAIAERFSDMTIVTSDNPRGENPETIVQEIVSGFKESRFIVEMDRAAAIKRAIEGSGKNDLILIAGKGHETYQLFAHHRIPFDDRQVAEEALRSVCGKF